MGLWLLCKCCGVVGLLVGHLIGNLVVMVCILTVDMVRPNATQCTASMLGHDVGNDVFHVVCDCWGTGDGKVGWVKIDSHGISDAQQ